MNYKGKNQSTAYIICPPEHEAQGDRLFASHQQWIGRTHHREGDKALLQYNVSKGKDDNGNVIYVLVAVFETEAGIDDHYARGDFELVDEFYEWMAKCDYRAIGKAVVINALW